MFSVSSIFANSWGFGGSTCQNRFSFFGLVEIWSGSITLVEYDNLGEPTGRTDKKDCTADGNWDWAW